MSGNVGASDGRVSGRVSGPVSGWVSGRVSGGSAGGSAGTGAQSATAAGATVNPAPLLSMCSLFLTKKKTKAKQKTMLDSFKCFLCFLSPKEKSISKRHVRVSRGNDHMGKWEPRWVSAAPAQVSVARGTSLPPGSAHPSAAAVAAMTPARPPDPGAPP